MLEYKAALYHARTVAVGPRYTSLAYTDHDLGSLPAPSMVCIRVL